MITLCPCAMTGGWQGGISAACVLIPPFSAR